jgi:anti-anti-sigma regulatory factor
MFEGFFKPNLEAAMTGPILCIRTDQTMGAVVLTVSGPLTTAEHISTLNHALAHLAPGFSLIIELDDMTTLSTTGLAGIRDLASSAAGQGVQLVLVSQSIDVRANLILSDLDSLAPVLHSLAQARQVVALAA